MKDITNRNCRLAKIFTFYDFTLSVCLLSLVGERNLEERGIESDREGKRERYASVCVSVCVCDREREGERQRVT